MRPDQKPGFFKMLWGLLYPFLLYQGISTVVSVAAGSLLMVVNMESLAAGATSFDAFVYALQDMILEHYGLLSAVTAVFTIPVLICLYHFDTVKEKTARVHEEWESVPAYHYVIVFVMGAAACLALNHLMIYSRLTELLQDGYEQTAELLFQGKLVFEIAVMGVLIPVVEELIFRGLAYRRIRWYLKPLPAMILSAMYFGAVHGNWLQGLYAFIIGMLLAFAYERFHSILAPILIHAGANTVSVVVTESGLFDFIYEDDTAFLIATAAAMVIFLVTFYLMVTYVYPRKKADAGRSGTESANGI